MTNPADEIYVIFDKKTGDIRTGSGKRGYKVVHAYLSEKMGWGAIGRIAQFTEEARDFYSVARRGSIIVMEDHGTFLKVHREYWVLTTPGITGWVLFHGTDIIHMLLRERDQGQVGTLLNYEE